MSAISLTGAHAPTLNAAKQTKKTNPKTIAIAIKKQTVKFFKAVILNSDTPLWIGNVGSIARSIEQITAPYFAVSAQVHKIISGSQLTALYNAPFDLKEVFSCLKNVIRAKSWEGRVDEGMEVLTNIGQVTEDIGGIAGGLQELKVLSSSLSWLSPLAIFSAVVSTLNYIIDGKAIYQCSKLLNKLNVKYLNNPKALVEKHGYHLGKQGNVNISSCTPLFKKMEASPDKKEAVQKRLSKALCSKLKSRRISQALNIVITTISLAATAIFLFTSAQSLLIAGASLVIALSVVAMVRRGMNLYSNYKFENRLEKIKIVLS